MNCPYWGCKPKPQKIPSAQIQPCQDRIQVDDLPSTVGGPELLALHRLQRDYPETAYVFVTERKAPLTTDETRKNAGRACRHAGLDFPIHLHMLRHATR